MGQKKPTPDLCDSKTTGIFFQQNYLDEIGNTPTYVANAIYSSSSFLNLSVTVSTLHIYDTPLLYQDQ